MDEVKTFATKLCQSFLEKPPFLISQEAFGLKFQPKCGNTSSSRDIVGEFGHLFVGFGL